jgi:hypothetical protein
MASPGPTKVTIFFATQGGTVPVGWTETWYDLSTFLPGALSNAKKYIGVRKNLLGKGAKITFIRVTDTANLRFTNVYQVPESEGIGSTYVNSPADDFDQAHEDLLVRVEAGAGNRRSWFISGLPDSQTDQLKVKGMDAAFVDGPLIGLVYGVILANNWAIRIGKKPNFTYPAITSFVARMVRNRKRGRPFDLFRGKRLG